jgi:hypothetical protein
VAEILWLFLAKHCCNAKKCQVMLNYLHFLSTHTSIGLLSVVRLGIFLRASYEEEANGGVGEK